MKKLLLSFLVLGLFFAYGMHEKGEESEAHVIAPNPEQKPQPTITQSESTQTVSPTLTQQSSSTYKDGSYTGTVEDVFYGNLQVRAIISGGRLTDIVFLQYPNDRDTSIQINQQAMPFLKQEAISAQNANVDIISGATDSSKGFVRSLDSALTQAKS